MSRRLWNWWVELSVFDRFQNLLTVLAGLALVAGVYGFLNPEFVVWFRGDDHLLFDDARLHSLAIVGFSLLFILAVGIGTWAEAKIASLETNRSEVE